MPCLDKHLECGALAGTQGGSPAAVILHGLMGLGDGRWILRCFVAEAIGHLGELVESERMHDSPLRCTDLGHPARGAFATDLVGRPAGPCAVEGNGVVPVPGAF